jgi:bifunctional non-homologous end joining protein LigD
VILDGEVVALDTDGRPSFSLLQQRMNVARPDPRLVDAVPVSYLVFDLLRLDGHDPTGLPWSERRRLLEALDLDHGPSGRVRVPPVILGDGATAWEAARSMRLEGVVAKRLDSPYVEGRRSPAWRKVKLLRTQEVILVGWAEGEGRRAGSIGALLLAVPDPSTGELASVGRVGTGFTDRALDDLAARLAPLERDTPPVVDPPRGAQARGVHWVDPELVGEVVFSEWTTARTLRQPSWRGLRPDKSPAEVAVEP